MTFLIEPARVGPRSRRGCLVLSWNHSKSTRASWCVTNTGTQTITPLRRFRLNLSLRLSARHTTRSLRDPRRAPRPRHAHRPLDAPAGQHARSRARRIFFRIVVVVVSSVVGGAFRTFRNYPKCPAQPKIRDAFPRPGKVRSGKNAIPSFQNVLGGLRACRWGRTPTRQAQAFFLFRTFLNVLRPGH